MGWTAVVNPVAGRGRTARMLPQLAAGLAARGVDTVVSTSATDAVARARDASGRGHDLVACGGDGLVGALAGVAAEQRCRLAIVPTGAGNDFASALGYDPKEPLGALDALVHGSDDVVDLGVADGTWFVGITCSGFDAEANRWANDIDRLTGTPLYVAAVLRTLARYRPQRFRVTVDGQAIEQEAWMVAVGNNRRYAGGMHVTPDASLHDGLLDVCLIGALSRAAFLRHFPSVFRGRHVEHPMVTMRRGRTVRVEPIDSPLPLEIWADGERIGPLPATVEARPAALTVRLPAGVPPPP